MREYLKTNQSNALKAMLRNFAFSITQKMKSGMLFAIGFFGTTILAVAISGTIKTWTTGEVLKSADLNTTIASLQTAIQNIPNWTKAANGTDAYFTDGKVGIGTASPGAALDVSQNTSGQADALIVRNRSTAQSDSSAINFANTMATLAKIRGYVGVTGNNGGAIDFQTRNGNTGLFTNVMTLIDNSNGTGNVGIGTASPNSTLNVLGKLEVGTGVRGVELSSTNSDNFLLRTFTNTPNPNFLIGIGNGAGGTLVTWLYGDNAGKIGIGTNSPTQMLTVNGNAGNTTGVWVNNSDERLKKNIQPLGNFLEKLTELRPVTFEWKNPKKLNAKEGKHIGFIAQEVEKVFPYWVDTDKDGMKWLSMEGVNAAFVQSFKEVALRLRSGNDQQAANEKKLLALEESNQKLIEDNKRLRETVETLRATSLRASQQLEDRLRAIENTQMARK